MPHTGIGGMGHTGLEVHYGLLLHETKKGEDDEWLDIHHLRLFYKYIIIVDALELSRLWGAWERNDIADVLHSSHEEDEALEAEAETAVRA